MTILAVKNQLISYFLDHDTFEFKKHQLELEFDKETVDFREQVTSAALKELEEAGLVKKMESESRVLWVLTKPLGMNVQHVAVGSLVASLMAETINFVNQAEGINILCDKTKIDEGDILRMVHIIEEGIEEDDTPQAPKVPTGKDD